LEEQVEHKMAMELQGKMAGLEWVVQEAQALYLVVAVEPADITEAVEEAPI
jgi:hypothetical protein